MPYKFLATQTAKTIMFSIKWVFVSVISMISFWNNKQMNEKIRRRWKINKWKVIKIHLIIWVATLFLSLFQVKILLRELCRLHSVPLPNEIDNLQLPLHRPGDFTENSTANRSQEQHSIDDSDADEIEDAVGESEPESEPDEDLPLEMDDGRNANKVSSSLLIPCVELKLNKRFLFIYICRKTKWKLNIWLHLNDFVRVNDKIISK